MGGKPQVTDVSEGQSTTNKDSATPKAPNPEEVPNISFFTLYRFANNLDITYIIISVILSILCAFCEPLRIFLFAKYLQVMVNSENEDDYDNLIKEARSFAIEYSIIGIITITFTYGATFMMNIAAYKQVYRIRQEYLRAALNQDFAYFDTHKTGDFASRMSDDVVKLEAGIGEKLVSFVYFQAVFVSSVGMALVKGWKLALLSLISLPVSLGLIGISGLAASRFSKAESTATGKAGTIAEEVISAVRTVYAFSGQQKELDRYQVNLKDARNINIKKSFFNGLTMGMLYLCIFSAYGLSLWFGYSLMRSEPENYDVDTMIAVFFGVMSGSTNFGLSLMLIEAFGVASGAGAQIFNLLNNEPTINPLKNQGTVPKSFEGSIELKNVVFHYPSRPDVPVLKGINLIVKRGQAVAMVGHSGCGKSTIIELICRYYDTVGGQVLIDGKDVRELSVRWLRGQIGLVGQQPALFSTTVRENIRHGREDASDADIEAVARQANAHHFIKKLPKGYDTLVGERGASLSGGQKQRIAIARALIRNPSILLLDEATSALDASSEGKVQRALEEAQKGRTTLIIAHRLSTIRNVDLIYVFKNGTVEETGNHDELMKKKGHYYDMVMVQTSAGPGTEEKVTHTEDNISQPLNRAVSKISEVDEEVVPEKDKKNETEGDEERGISFWTVVRLNSPEWKSITIASIASILNGVCMPLVALIFGDFIGVLADPNDEKALAAIKRYALTFVGLGVYSGIMNFVPAFCYGIAGAYLTERLRSLMLKKMLEQEIAYFDDIKNSTGSLCSRLASEAGAVQGATGLRIGTVLQAIGTFIFGVLLTMIYEWRIGLVASAFMPLFMFIVYKEGKMTSAESFGTAKTMEASSKIAVEAVTNVRTVASLGREQQIQQEYAVQLLPALEIAKRAAHWRGLVFGLSRGYVCFILSAVMYYGANLMADEGVGYAAVFTSSQSLLMGAAGAAGAFSFAPDFQKGIKAARRIIVFLKRQSKIRDPDTPFIENFKGTGEASFQGVYFKYPTRPMISVLNNLDLEIGRGKTIALVGGSGCGKSTVIQLLERYYDPDEGIVAQDNIPIKQLRLSDARGSIGFVQQEPVLFDRTIGENIAYGDNTRKPDMDEIVEAAKQANIHNFVGTLPMGYDTNIGSKGTQLSGGQKQRIAIARALIRKPKMLLLDEATSALDTESEKIVQEALQLAKAGRTCVMIAHRLSTVRDADVICVIQGGRVAERGTHSQLMDLKGLYYNLNREGS